MKIIKSIYFNCFFFFFFFIRNRCNNSIIEQVVDRFSDKIFIRNVEDGRFSFSTDVILSDGLVNWILQFGDNIKVEAPTELIGMVKGRIGEIVSLYE